MDCEWPPYGKAIPSIMQIATHNYSVILDIYALVNQPVFQNFIDALFKSKSIIKVGHVFRASDQKSLREAYGLPCFNVLENYVDIADLHLTKFPNKRNSVSLAKLTAIYLSIAAWQLCKTVK